MIAPYKRYEDGCHTSHSPALSPHTSPIVTVCSPRRRSHPWIRNALGNRNHATKPRNVLLPLMSATHNNALSGAYPGRQEILVCNGNSNLRRNRIMVKIWDPTTPKDVVSGVEVRRPNALRVPLSPWANSGPNRGFTPQDTYRPYHDSSGSSSVGLSERHERLRHQRRATHHAAHDDVTRILGAFVLQTSEAMRPLENTRCE